MKNVRYLPPCWPLEFQRECHGPNEFAFARLPREDASMNRSPKCLLLFAVVAIASAVPIAGAAENDPSGKQTSTARSQQSTGMVSSLISRFIPGSKRPASPISQEQGIVIPVSDEPYEPLDGQYLGTLPPRVDSDGKTLLRAAMIQGSYKQSIERFLSVQGYKAVWTDAPTCLDWTITSSYVVQAPDLKTTLERLTNGYPLRVTVHTPSRIVDFRVDHFYRLDCQ